VLDRPYNCVVFITVLNNTSRVHDDDDDEKHNNKSVNHAINDLVAHAFTSADLPVTKKLPHGLTRSDGKRPDGLTMVPWKEGKPLTWNVTVVCPTAESYIEASASDAVSAAELAVIRKSDKYSALQRTNFFQPVAEASSQEVSTGDYNIQRQPEIAIWPPKPEIVIPLELRQIASKFQRQVRDF